MPLTLHDTLAREKRVFEPRDPARITLYVCGPTVYNFAHVGNARPVVVFDVLYRVLRGAYGEQAVVYARNVTDVDDKIVARAAAEGAAMAEITERYTAAFHADMAALGALPPSLEPRATAHIPAMIDQIGRLVAAGAAYVADGHVLFDTVADPTYGALSGRALEDLIAGARVEVAAYKRHPADFVLWKPSKPGEPAWPSPWGEGRPGWHIECSAMIEEELGLPVDIHGGGHDLIFPHHENELAQGRGATGGGEYARYWVHNGFLTMDAEKMSKSTGNVQLVRDMLADTPGEAIRWALLSAHYRAPLDWTAELIAQSRRSLDRLYGVLQRSGGAGERAAEPPGPFLEALHDDLNTPRAIAELFALAKAVEAADTKGARRAAKADLLAAANLLGFLQADPDAWFEGGADEALKARIDALVKARGEARVARDWPVADRLRAELTELGVEVLDGPGGTATWRLREA